MSNFRTLRTGSALSLESVRQYCPAVFATEPHASRGPRYQYIPTIEPLERLLSDGWGIFEASQVRASVVDRAPYVRHSLRLRRLDDSTALTKYGTGAEGTAELVLTNGHDGTAAYTLQAGFFRLVCANGLTVSQSVGQHRIVHSKGRATSAVIDVVARVLEEDFPVMMQRIDRFKAVALTRDQQYTLADTALALRFPGAGLKPFTADKLLTSRRSVDAGATAWRVLNRIQENVMQGGFMVNSLFTGRKVSIRPIEAVAAVGRINTGLWAKAEALLSEEV